MMIHNSQFKPLNRNEVKSLLTNASSCVKDGGFLLIHCPTENIEMLTALHQVNQFAEISFKSVKYFVF